ncbi:MAG: hypothetical protein ACLPX9_18575 [Rhodomicrobium sp.]
MAKEADFWFIQFKDLINIAILLATVAAIMWGPIIAVRMEGTLAAAACCQ